MNGKEKAERHSHTLCRPAITYLLPYHYSRQCREALYSERNYHSESCFCLCIPCSFHTILFSVQLFYYIVKLPISFFYIINALNYVNIAFLRFGHYNIKGGGNMSDLVLSVKHSSDSAATSTHFHDCNQLLFVKSGGGVCYGKRGTL